MKVRCATHADIPAAIRFGAAMQQESPRFSRLGYAPEKVEALARVMVERGGSFVAEKGDTIVGMMGGFVSEHFFSYDKVASDLMVYVAPEHRGGSAFYRLLTAFEQWAFVQGAVEIVLGVSTEIVTDQTIAMYERLGYKRLQSGCLVKRVT